MSQAMDIIQHHGKKYPFMRAQDACKLLFQQEFGCGHFIESREKFLESLKQEWGNTTAKEGAIVEDIGGGYARLHLGAAKKAGILPETVALFSFAAVENRGSFESFQKKAEKLLSLLEQESHRQVVAEFLDRWETQGRPLFSHSEDYKAQYGPAYRVVNLVDEAFLPVVDKINRLLLEKPRVQVAIDGRCGSGKTTLAKALCRFFDANVVMMDEFFLPTALRTEARMAEVGGNVHYERFTAEVVAGLASGVAFSYRTFDCSVMDFRHENKVLPKPLTIVEGTYALHPSIAQASYDLKIFCDVSPALQAERIIQRNGQSGYAIFKNRWIPLEEAYFTAFQTKDHCDMVVLL